MSDRNDFRIVNEFEKSIIFKTLDKICQNSDILIKNFQNRMYISYGRTSSRGLNPSVYLISADQQNLLRKFESDIQIISVGLYFGFFKKGRFYISLESVEFLYKKGILSESKFIYVNKNGEKSILYRNDLVKDMVTKTPLNLQKHDFLLVFNELDEILAIAHSQVENKLLHQLKSNDVVAINLIDKGFYLRKKQ